MVIYPFLASFIPTCSSGLPNIHWKKYTYYISGSTMKHNVSPSIRAFFHHRFNKIDKMQFVQTMARHIPPNRPSTRTPLLISRNQPRTKNKRTPPPTRHKHTYSHAHPTINPDTGARSRSRLDRGCASRTLEIAFSPRAHPDSLYTLGAIINFGNAQEFNKRAPYALKLGHSRSVLMHRGARGVVG